MIVRVKLQIERKFKSTEIVLHNNPNAVASFLRIKLSHKYHLEQTTLLSLFVTQFLAGVEGTVVN